MISIIFPDDAHQAPDYLHQPIQDREVVFVPKSAAKTRAERLNLGISQAQGQMILLHHPRSRIEPEGLEWLRKNQHQQIWGGFTHQFDIKHPLLQYTSWYSNRLRPRLSGVLYLDHCIFFHRTMLTQPIPAVPIFEDTLLSYQLRQHGRPVVLPYDSVTSAVRYLSRGVWPQAVTNQVLKIGFYLGVSPARLNAWYERRLNLN